MACTVYPALGVDADIMLMLTPPSTNKQAHRQVHDALYRPHPLHDLSPSSLHPNTQFNRIHIRTQAQAQAADRTAALRQHVYRVYAVAGLYAGQPHSSVDAG